MECGGQLDVRRDAGNWGEEVEALNRRSFSLETFFFRGAGVPERPHIIFDPIHFCFQ